MFALSIVASVLVAVPDRPLPAPANSWIGKTVYAKTNGLQLDLSPQPGDPKVATKGAVLNMVSYRVYAERPDHVQVRTREGQNGWLRKMDLVPLEDAVAFFTKQIEANPNDLNAYNRRGAAWRAKGELDAALKDATEAIRLGPSAALYNNRALIWQAKKDYDKAIADYAQAFNLSPQYPLAFVNRASLWQAKKDFDKAIADTTLAIQLQPQFPNAYRVRGVAWHAMKEYDKAIADFNRALELDPKFSQARTDRANSWAAKKDHAKAFNDYQESLRLEPTNVANAAATALWLASCPDASYRDGKRALEIARQAQKLEGSNSRVLQALAAAYAELGQFADAVRWQEHALQDPQLKGNNDARARLELYREGKAYRRD